MTHAQVPDELFGLSQAVAGRYDAMAAGDRPPVLQAFTADRAWGPSVLGGPGEGEAELVRRLFDDPDGRAMIAAADVLALAHEGWAYPPDVATEINAAFRRDPQLDVYGAFGRPSAHPRRVAVTSVLTATRAGARATLSHPRGEDTAADFESTERGGQVLGALVDLLTVILEDTARAPAAADAWHDLRMRLTIALAQLADLGEPTYLIIEDVRRDGVYVQFAIDPKGLQAEVAYDSLPAELRADPAVAKQLEATGWASPRRGEMNWTRDVVLRSSDDVKDVAAASVAALRDVLRVAGPTELGYVAFEQAGRGGDVDLPALGLSRKPG